MTEKLTGPHRAAWREALKEKPEFTLQQVAAALSRHDLGRVQEWERHGGNMINSVYKVTCSDGCYFLKIQFRPGFSLKAEHEATQLIRAATSLPVPDLSIVDEDAEPFGHPFLITSQLPGNPGRVLFESADQPTQLRILKEYGRVVAQLHGIQSSESTLPQRDYGD